MVSRVGSLSARRIAETSVAVGGLATRGLPFPSESYTSTMIEVYHHREDLSRAYEVVTRDGNALWLVLRVAKGTFIPSTTSLVSAGTEESGVVIDHDPLHKVLE